MPTNVMHTSDFRQRDITLAVNIRVAAPEVLAGEMGDGHLNALMPSVVVRTKSRDDLSGECSHGMEVGFGTLKRRATWIIDIFK
jgi:hypothetical protein